MIAPAFAASLLFAQAASAPPPAPAAPDSTQRSHMANAGTLLLMPGDRVVLGVAPMALVSVGDAKADAASAAGSAAPDGDVAASFTKTDPANPALKIENGLMGPVRYRAALIMGDADGNVRLFNTDTCPVAAGKAWVEHLPAGVLGVALGRFEPAPADAKPCA